MGIDKFVGIDDKNNTFSYSFNGLVSFDNGEIIFLI